MSERRSLGWQRHGLADDPYHDVVRSGLRRLLEAQPGWEVVAKAADGKDAIAKATETRPGVAVLDSMMPFVNARRRKTEVLIFTLYDDARHIGEILEAGARGYVPKSDTAEQLLDAIAALRTKNPFSPPQFRKPSLGLS